jgi:microcystin-dependent protein
MSQPFMGEIKIVAFNFAPKGWAQCNGQFLPINQNQALFSILGTVFGGNGQTTFALPDYRGRSPIHVGSGFTLGEKGGQEAHTLTQSELPAHNHFVACSNASGSLALATKPTVPEQHNTWAISTQNPYNTVQNTAMSPTNVTNVGGSQPHQNMQPYLVLTFCIALIGIFPSRN